MAQPNLLNISTITGNTIGTTLTTDTTTTIVSCPPNTVLKINSITVNSGGDAVDVFVDYYDSSNDETLALAGGLDPVAVNPLLSSIRVLDKDLTVYLEEGDEIRAGAGDPGVADLVMSYEEIT